MAVEDKPRGSVATVVATAAVTLAIGVTAAAFGGYLAPAGARSPELPAMVTPSPAETRSSPRAEAPAVVLVPVAPEPRVDPRQTALPAEPETVLAAYERAVREDEEEGEDDLDHQQARGHGEQERERDDD